MTQKVGLSPARVRALIMDTTNGNPAVLREAQWSHAMYLECLQHVFTLAMRDLMSVPAFAAAHDCAQDISTWFRRSAKRIEALKKFAKLLPLGTSNTRFGQHFLVMERITALFPALSKMHAHVADDKPLFNGGVGQDPKKTVADFKQLYTSVLTK
jgi:hypothetical protein